MSQRAIKTFSVSREFEEDVFNILNSVPNTSRYICEAIIEKYINDNKPQSSIPVEVMTQLIGMMNGNNQVVTESVIGETNSATKEDILEELRESNKKKELHNPKDIVAEALKQNEIIKREDVLNQKDETEEENQEEENQNSKIETAYQTEKTEHREEIQVDNNYNTNSNSAKNIFENW